MKIPQDVRDLIESGCLAHLVTLNRDGSPQVTLIWIGLDGDCQFAHVNVPGIRGNNDPAIRGHDVPLFERMQNDKIIHFGEMLKRLCVDLHLLEDVPAPLRPETGTADDDHFSPVQQSVQPC